MHTETHHIYLFTSVDKSPVATAKRRTTTALCISLSGSARLHIVWDRIRMQVRFFVPGILLWGAVTNILYFLPAPRNLPVALCKHSTEFFALEVAFQTRDESASGGPKTDGLLIATGVISLLATFYSAGCLLVLSGRRATVRGATLTLTPLFALSVTCVILMLFSALANKGCNLASGFFIKVIEVAGIVLIYTIVSEASVPETAPSPPKTIPNDSDSSTNWDPDRVVLGFA